MFTLQSSTITRFGDEHLDIPHEKRTRVFFFIESRFFFYREFLSPALTSTIYEMGTKHEIVCTVQAVKIPNNVPGKRTPNQRTVQKIP